MVRKVKLSVLTITYSESYNDLSGNVPSRKNDIRPTSGQVVSGLAVLQPGGLFESDEAENMRSIGSGLIVVFLIVSLIAVSYAPGATSTDLGIVMVTDKTHYAPGETVKLRITNNLDVAVWYIDYHQSDLVLWQLERAQDNGWEVQTFRLPRIEGNTEICQLILYERPIGNVTALKAHSHLLCEWNQKVCAFGVAIEPAQPEMIERGTYRFTLSYSLCTAKTENTQAEPWKRPIELGEIKVVYSNEFVLE